MNLVAIVYPAKSVLTVCATFVVPTSSEDAEDDNPDFEVDTNCSSKDLHFPNQD